MDDKKPMWSEIPTYEDYFPENATLGKNNTELKQQLKQSQLDLEQANKDKQELAEALNDAADDLSEFNSQDQQSTNKEYKALAEKHLK